MTTILVGTDSSAAADLAVDHAARLARDRESDLVVLLVRPDDDLRSVVDPGKAADPDRYLAHVAERFPGVPTSTSSSGLPATVHFTAPTTPLETGVPEAPTESAPVPKGRGTCTPDAAP